MFAVVCVYPVAAYDARRNIGIDCTLHIVLICRQKQIGSESIQIRRERSAARKYRSRYVQAVISDGVKYAKRCIRAVARHNNHFHTAFPAGQAVQIQQRFYQRKTRPRLQYFILVLHLVTAVCFHALFLKNFIFTG